MSQIKHCSSQLFEEPRNPPLYMEWPHDLTPLEQLSPRIFIRLIIAFQLHDDCKFDSVARLVQDAWKITVQQFEPLTRQAVVCDEASQANVLKLKAAKIDPPFLVRDLRQRGAFPFTYNDLRDQSFPMSALDPKRLDPTGLWADTSKPIPISAVQLTFIRGGAFLALNFFHPVLDMTSVGSVIKFCSQACRRAQQPAADGALTIQDMVMDRRVVCERSFSSDISRTNRQGRKSEYNLAYAILRNSSELREALADDYVSQIFYFPQESLNTLKSDASQNFQPRSGIEFISTNNALMALVWRTLMVARFSSVEDDDDSLSSIEIAMDGRREILPPISPETFGCFVKLLRVELPLRRVINAGSLPELAVSIRQAITAARASEAHMEDFIEFATRTPDLGLVIASGLRDLAGRSCIVTSWEAADILNLDWGEALGGRCDALRLPNGGLFNGLPVISPRLADGGRELFLTLRKDCLSRVECDPLLNKYCRKRNVK